jgi:hypothetical protein
MPNRMVKFKFLNSNLKGSKQLVSQITLCYLGNLLINIKFDIKSAYYFNSSKFALLVESSMLNPMNNVSFQHFKSKPSK